jgi:diguanylate cyclase (GGDEF)-like protein
MTMKDAPGTQQQALAVAREELALLDQQAMELRATLTHLQAQVRHTQNHLRELDPANELLEANEALVMRLLHAQDEAASATRALNEIAQSIGIDELTNLPNRGQLLKRIEHTIAHAVRLGDGFAVLFLDLNNFKSINDNLGHRVGDAALKQVAQCLKASVRETDTVSRYGGDEFLVLLNNICSKADVITVVEKIIDALNVTRRIHEHPLSLKVSIGICRFPEDGENPQLLIDQADAAMYRAKRHGAGGFQFHDDPQHHDHDTCGQPPRVLVVPAPHTQQQAHLDHLREANEQLVLAALGAQQLQSGAELALQQQQDLLAKVAHELRNPLTPLSMSADLLLRMKSDELPRIQAIIERQVKHMSRLVEDLLDVSRVNAGKLRLDRQPLDLADILQEALDTCRAEIDLRQQQMTVHIPQQPLALYGDSLRLAQIFCNLLGNAVKYTPREGQITLDVKVSAQWVQVTISDSGIGISPTMLPFIFEPYVQDAHAMSFDGNGLGIGLTVVRELVLAHDGDVTAHSDGLGLGSQFVIRLPLLPAP